MGSGGTAPPHLPGITGPPGGFLAHSSPAPDSCRFVCPDRGVNSVFACPSAPDVHASPRPTGTDGVDADRGTRTMRQRGRGVTYINSASHVRERSGRRQSEGPRRGRVAVGAGGGAAAACTTGGGFVRYGECSVRRAAWSARPRWTVRAGTGRQGRVPGSAGRRGRARRAVRRRGALPP